MSTLYIVRPSFLFHLAFFFFLLFGGALASYRPEIRVLNAVVAADDERCSKVGRRILRRYGGNAIDSAIATAICLGTVSPANSGIGGGSFMLVRLANGTVKAFDARERAPIAAREDLFNHTSKAKGPMSVATPGQLAGFYEAWKQYGRLPWRMLLEPSEEFARNGFIISDLMYYQMNVVSEDIFNDTGLQRVFAPNGTLLLPGEKCYNIALANTLQRLFSGVGDFYNGQIGRNLVLDIRRNGGILQLEDLRNYSVVMREPLSWDIKNLKFFSFPPPSSGGASLALMLNILAQYGFPVNVSEPLQVHRQVECLKHAFAVRTNLGDPDFDKNVSDVVSDMLSINFAISLKNTILDNETLPNITKYGGKWSPFRDRGTSHLSVIDQERNAVAMTKTINYHFGSRFMSTSTGIILNNEMDDFYLRNDTNLEPPSDDVFPPGNITNGIRALPPARCNLIAPLKRPMSCMTPTIILEDGKLRAVIGGSGGRRIVAAVTEVFLNYFSKGLELYDSVLAPRFYHQLDPNYVEYENQTAVTNLTFLLPESIRDGLVKREHVLESLPGGAFVQIAIQEIEDLKAGQLVAVSDPRTGGAPAGF